MKDLHRYLPTVPAGVLATGVLHGAYDIEIEATPALPPSSLRSNPSRMIWVQGLISQDEEETAESLPVSIRENWQSFATSGISVQLFTRILDLSTLQDGWRGANSKGLTAGSLRSFLQFWRLVRNDAKEPFTTVAPNGNLYCEWHSSWKRHLDIEFVSGGSVYFGLFHNDQVVEGREKLKSLAAMLRARDKYPLNWG